MTEPAPVESMNEYPKQRYDAYIRERTTLDSNFLALSERYSKAILTLSGGSLALSVTFLEKIAPHPQHWSLLFLVVAWILLLVSMVMELFGLKASQDAIGAAQRANESGFANYRKAYDADPAAVGEPASDEEVQKHNDRVGRFDTIGLTALVCGLGMLCVFSLLNICLPAPTQEKVAVTNEKKIDPIEIARGAAAVPIGDGEASLTYRVPTAALPPVAPPKPVPPPAPKPTPSPSTSDGKEGDSK